MSLAAQVTALAARIATEVKANTAAIALRATTTYVDTGDKHQLTDPGEAAAPASFADGISLISVLQGAWSIASDSMTVMTVRGGSEFRVTQTAFIKTTGDIYTRVSQGSAPATWTAWQHMADRTDLAAYAPLASPTFTGTVAGITKSMVGLGSVDNTADTAKPVSTAQQTALNLKANLSGATFTGTVSGVTAAANDSTTKFATTAYVQGEIAQYANIASPQFTGTPKSVTPSTSDNSTMIATTAFVKAQGYITQSTADGRYPAAGSNFSASWTTYLTIASGGGSRDSATVTFPSGMFSGNPYMQATPNTSTPDNCSVSVGNISATSCSVYLSRKDGSTTAKVNTGIWVYAATP